MAQFEKAALTRPEHIERLRNRGLVFEDARMDEVLQVVSYYRLSGYLYPFRTTAGESYAMGTTLDEVWRIYTFDRQLRLLVLDALERFEVALRADLFDRLALDTGAFGYLDPDTFPRMTGKDFAGLLGSVSREFERSTHDFVKHFKDAHGDAHKFPPFWMAAELVDFGLLDKAYRGASRSVQREIASRYGVREDVFKSWLLSLRTVRNICAHHSRLWNRVIGTTPKLPPREVAEEWYSPVGLAGPKVFTILSILLHVVSVAAPNSGWPYRLAKMFGEYPEIRKGMMGFPDGDWTASPVWASFAAARGDLRRSEEVTTVERVIGG